MAIGSLGHQSVNNMAGHQEKLGRLLLILAQTISCERGERGMGAEEGVTEAHAGALLAESAIVTRMQAK